MTGELLKVARQNADNSEMKTGSNPKTRILLQYRR